MHYWSNKQNTLPISAQAPALIKTSNQMIANMHVSKIHNIGSNIFVRTKSKDFLGFDVLKVQLM
jgi:hypothetical protein